ncbi:ABC transporter permease [Clostridium tyrobutyricum]|uniref:ABC transporter permease n=1 Tax=Clostridium tyrobutyricum TaxID=1519 RepID=UPI003F62FBF8
MRELLRLIKCEFWKLKRKKFILFVIIAAFLFPIPITYLMTTPSMMERYVNSKDAFDGLFNIILGYGVQFLLPCIVGVIAAILFFMERDNDTFKNLRTIPITSTQIILVKIMVLFLLGIVFSVASTAATALCGMVNFQVYGLGYKLFLAVETGIFITAGTLPLIVLVVFFSRTYIFSVLLCIFYSVLNMSATALFDTLPKTILLILPTPLTTFWIAGDMESHGINMNLDQMAGLIPSTLQVIITLGIMSAISILLIVYLYRKWGE